MAGARKVKSVNSRRKRQSSPSESLEKSSSKKARRSQNPTTKQKEALLVYMEKHQNFACNRLNAKNAAKLKDKMKSKMAKIVNEADPNGPQRSGERWWKTWCDFKKNAKGKAADNYRPISNKTGGGDETINSMDSVEPVSIDHSEQYTCDDDWADRVMAVIGWHSALGIGVADELDSGNEKSSEGTNEKSGSDHDEQENDFVDTDSRSVPIIDLSLLFSSPGKKFGIKGSSKFTVNSSPMISNSVNSSPMISNAGNRSPMTSNTVNRSPMTSNMGWVQNLPSSTPAGKRALFPASPTNLQVSAIPSAPSPKQLPIIDNAKALTDALERNTMAVGRLAAVINNLIPSSLTSNLIGPNKIRESEIGGNDEVMETGGSLESGTGIMEWGGSLKSGTDIMETGGSLESGTGIIETRVLMENGTIETDNHIMDPPMDINNSFDPDSIFSVLLKC